MAENDTAEDKEEFQRLGFSFQSIITHEKLRTSYLDETQFTRVLQCRRLASASSSAMLKIGHAINTGSPYN